jgi:hypothetical protein
MVNVTKDRLLNTAKISLRILELIVALTFLIKYRVSIVEPLT